MLVSRVRRLRGLRFFSREFTIFFVCKLELCLIISPLCNFSSSSALRNFILSSVGYFLFFYSGNANLYYLCLIYILILIVTYFFRSIIHFSISSGVDRSFNLWYKPVRCCILICFSTSKGCAENVQPSIPQSMCVLLCSERTSADGKSLSQTSQ